MARFTRFIAALAVAPVLVLAACGDDDDRSANEEFIAEADAGCVETSRESNELYAKEGLPASFEEDVELLEKRLPISEEGVERASTVEPPEELADDYDEYLAERETFIDLLRQQLQVGQAGDEAAYIEFRGRLEDSSDVIDEAGRWVGLGACAQVLPEEQAEDVRAVIEDTATTGDPAHCTEDYTENYVEAGGGLEQCKSGESEAENQAESVEISDVKGVDEVYAIATAMPTGGSADGQELLVELVFEDGRWKIDAITPLSPASTSS